MWVLLVECAALFHPTRLKTENGFGDDVALDFVRSAIDRDFSPVEIGRAGCCCVVRADRRFVGLILVVERVGEGCYIGADDVHQQFGGGLLQLGAFDFEDRGVWVRGAMRAALAGLGDDTELGDFQGFEFDLDGGDFLAEPALVEEFSIPERSSPASSTMRRRRWRVMPVRAMPMRSLVRRNLA